MKLRWTASAERDLVQFPAFLVTINSRAAAQAARQLVAGTEQLMQYPQLGVKLDEFIPRDIRRIIIGDYEIRYELTDETIYILRLWHGRGDR